MDRSEAEQILRIHRVEVSLEDPRSVYEVAQALIDTGSPLPQQKATGEIALNQAIQTEPVEL
jgi:hypothetical protein